MTLVYFIGGAADKRRERFGPIKWGPSKLMAAVQAEYEEQRGPYSSSRYFAYTEVDSMLKDIVRETSLNPNLQINLVGHSRGATLAIDLACRELLKKDVKSNIVIALDPVKIRLFSIYGKPDKQALSNVFMLVCAHAKPTRLDATDLIAVLGGQYGVRMRKFTQHYTQIDTNHGNPLQMLQTPIASLGKSAFALLLEASRQA